MPPGKSSGGTRVCRGLFQERERRAGIRLQGQLLFNEIISEKRQESVERYILDNLDIPPQIFFSEFVSQDWENLAKAIEEDPAYFTPFSTA